jgi:3-oxoacyl-[acyl-carrier protein] reductase
MENLFSLKGKTAWITGGKRIGKKIAEVLAEHGANVIVSYNSSKKDADEAIDSLKKYGVKSLAVKADVSKRKDISNAVSQIKKEFGKIDILVLMASVFERKKLELVTDEDLDRNFAVHIKGTFWPIMESLGIIGKGAHIITVADMTSIGQMYADYFPYVVTKGAITYLTKEVSVELAGKGIFINSIAPGPILKPDFLPDSEWKKIRKQSIINYPMDDETAMSEFAKLVLYLSCVKSTGSTYPLDLGHV